MRKTKKQRIVDKLWRYRNPNDQPDELPDGHSNDCASSEDGRIRTRKTQAEVHEEAFRAGRDTAIQFLGKVVCFGAPRSMEHPVDYNADREFVRGFVETLLPLLGDTVPLLRGEVGLAIREAVINDLYSISRTCYEQIRNSTPPQYRARW